MNEPIKTELLKTTILVTLPENFRNDNWARDFGKLQQLLRQEINSGRQVIIDASKCIWVDPIPMLSLIIGIREVCDSLYVQMVLKASNNESIDQCRLMSFLEKEGFLEELINSKCTLVVEDGENGLRELTGSDREEYRKFGSLLSFDDPTVIKAQVVDLNDKIKDGSIDDWVDHLLIDRYKFTQKFKETSKDEIFSRINLFLKETLDNIYEHAYPDSNVKKLAGLYIRLRKGLADNSLDMSARIQLKNAIDKEHIRCPRLEKHFLEDISSFIEIFIVDSGIGITDSYFKHKKRPKYPFREAWRDTIGFGLRGIDNPKKKNTKFGGLYTLSRLLYKNYLTARDQNEWIGDVLPIQPSEEGYESNRSYVLISKDIDLKGLALIGRITWMSASDKNSIWGSFIGLSEHNTPHSHPFAKILMEEKDIYTKYERQPFKEFSYNPHYVRDDKYGYQDEALLSKYLMVKGSVDYTLYLPKSGLTKNAIHHIVENEFLDVNETSRSLIIGDICVWETNLYELALKDAKYSEDFLKKYDNIILVSKRLSVLYLENDGKTFRHNSSKQLAYITNSLSTFDPASCFSHYIEWVRTHDSMIFWQYLNQTNKLNEYYINAKIDWYQGNSSVELNGYLNYSKTLTDRFCMSIYENALERSLSLDNGQGCKYESIDVLTSKLSQKFNSLFYNQLAVGARIINLGSVIVTGYASRLLSQNSHLHDSPLNLHFFYNLNGSSVQEKNPEMHLLLWPLRGKEWFDDHINKTTLEVKKGGYRRVGATHVIAPAGWKYFPIPRYKLLDVKKKSFVDSFTSEQANDNDNYKFISIYKCSPRDTYGYWQGKKSEVVSLAHSVYEGNHDLFKIDFQFVLNESFALGDELAIFLLGEFLINLGMDHTDLITDNGRFRDGVERYINEELKGFSRSRGRSTLIVYPYHYNTEYAIELIKGNLPEGVHDKIVAIFPINKDRHGSSFFPSPITIETISQIIDKEMQQMDSEGKKYDINAMLFDDATIGGKTRSDINHIMYSLNVKHVNTVSIIERSRLPFSTSYPFRHRAFWRLDIPKLGNVDSCPVCRAFKDIDAFSVILVSRNALDRVRTWFDVWSKKSPLEIKGEKMVTPVALGMNDRDRFKKFGIYYDGEDHQQCGGEINKIELTNSIGLSIYTAELYSNTSRDDLALQYLSNAELSDSAKLEMLCTNMLLFGQEFSRVVKSRMMSAIFLLADKSEENNLTSLAAIALLSQSKESLENLYDVAKDKQEGDVQVKNLDMQIVLSRQSSYRDSRFFGLKKLMRLHMGFQTLKILYKQFHSELFNDFGLAHDTPLQLMVREMSTTSIATTTIRDSCDKVIFLLDRIPIWHLRKLDSDPQKDTLLQANIVRQLNEIKGFVFDSEFDGIERLENFKRIGDICVEDLRNFHDRLFLCVNGQEAQNVASVLGDFTNEANLKIGVSVNLPISRPNDDFSNWICWDRIVLDSLVAILGNTRHANRNLILNPYGDGKEVMEGWLTAELGDGQFILKIANYSELRAADVINLTSKRNKPEKSHLKELDITVNYKDFLIDDLVLLETIIKFPYLNSY